MDEQPHRKMLEVYWNNKTCYMIFDLNLNLFIIWKMLDRVTQFARVINRMVWIGRIGIVQVNACGVGGFPHTRPGATGSDLLGSQIFI